jgi:hypothetical protein
LNQIKAGGAFEITKMSSKLEGFFDQLLGAVTYH